MPDDNDVDSPVNCVNNQGTPAVFDGPMNNKKRHRQDLRYPKTILEPIRHVVEARDVGVTFDDVLAHLGSSREQYTDPNLTINGDQYLDLLRWLKRNTQGRLTLKDWLNYYTVTSGGLVGIAALSAVSVRDALMITDRFLQLIVPGIKVELQEGPVHTRYVIELRADFEEMSRFLIEMVLAIINAACEDAMGGRNERTVHFMHDCGTDAQGRSRLPEYEELFLGYPVYFNCDFNGMAGESKNLELKTQRANEATYHATKQILEQQLASLQAGASFSTQVHDKLVEMAAKDQHPTLEEFADIMHVSPRTLIRKLGQEDTSFKQLINQVRLKRSRELLANTSLSIKQIAARTGFTNANSFSRAFKALSGDTPLQWRKQNQTVKR